MHILPQSIEIVVPSGMSLQELEKTGDAVMPSGSMEDDEEIQCDCGDEEENEFCEQDEDPFTGPSEGLGQDAEVEFGGRNEQQKDDGKAPEARTIKSSVRAQSLGARLEELARPRPTREPVLDSPKPPPRPQKKTQTTRPSLLLRLKPTNLEEAMEAFFNSGFSVAPQFTYAFPDEYVTEQFQANSNVCFELLPEAKRILQRVQDEYGGPEAFMQRLYGVEKVPAEELQKTVAAYLQDHNVEDKVEIRIVDSMLSAANVVKPSPDEKYVVNINKGPISRNMVQGICDHEVGTHLLRMMNDEHQAWHGHRDRYKLINPWTTEEGFATLNTYISMPCKLLYAQALRYFAVCRGAQTGFVELFHELQAHISDPKRCWQMCCRIKRGMIDTSLPGAFYMDQAYFKGAVEILRHLDEIDFGRLYGGQIALQDLDKVHFVLRKEVVRLPHFLKNAEKLKTYMSHCRKLIKENQIETVVERVCKPVFVRTAREFFKQKETKKICNMTIGFSAPSLNPEIDNSNNLSRPFDLGRLESLARPRQTSVEPEITEGEVNKRRDLDLGRIGALAMPRCRTEPEDTAPENEPRRDFNRARLLELARPRTDMESTQRRQRRGASAPAQERRRQCTRSGSKEDSNLNTNRSEGGSNDDNNQDDQSHDQSRPKAAEVCPPPPPPFAPEETSCPSRPVDLARLKELAMPRIACKEDESQPCNCPPKGSVRRKRRNKLRITAMVQEKRSQQDDDNDLTSRSQGDRTGTPQEIEVESVIQLDMAKFVPPSVTVPDEGNAVIHMASEEKQRDVAQQESKPRRRSLPRARSLGAKLVPTTDALATDFDPTYVGGTAAALAANPKDPFNFNFGAGPVSRAPPRMPSRLSRVAAAVTNNTDGSLWKAVPITMMQLNI